MRFEISESQANFLVTKYLSLVHSIARKICYNENDYEDFIQIGLEKLCDCHRTYNENHEGGAEFHTYAYRAIIRAMLKKRRELEKVYKKEKTIGINTTDTTCYEENMFCSGVPISPSFQTDNSNEIFEVIDNTNLSAIQRRILFMRIEGNTLTSIGKELGFTAERIRQIHDTTKSKLKKQLM